MNTMLDRLFVTPISWLLAVPIVLLDRLLSPKMAGSQGWNPRTVPQCDADHRDLSC